MNIFDAILEAIQACEADIIDSRQCATGEQRSNCKEVAIAERLVEQLRDGIKQLESDGIESEAFAITPHAKLYSTAQSVTCKRILNMEFKND